MGDKRLLLTFFQTGRQKGGEGGEAGAKGYSPHPSGSRN